MHYGILFIPPLILNQTMQISCQNSKQIQINAILLFTRQISLRNNRFRGEQKRNIEKQGFRCFDRSKKWGESKNERVGRGRGGKETLARKSQRSEECVRPQTRGSDWRGRFEMYILITANQFFV